MISGAGTTHALCIRRKFDLRASKSNRMEEFVPSVIPTPPRFEFVTLITLCSSKTARKAKHAI
jgi:hypothetical protein